VKPRLIGLPLADRLQPCRNPGDAPF
jgi:hypothetical protein